MEPVRTCVGCRQRLNPKDLIRVVVSQDSLVVDSKKSLGGRGAWLHPASSCLELAQNRNAFLRALKISRKLDDSVLIQTIEQAEEMTSK